MLYNCAPNSIRLFLQVSKNEEGFLACGTEELQAMIAETYQQKSHFASIRQLINCLPFCFACPNGNIFVVK